MPERRPAIGVFDSGVGGLTALVKLAELLPAENLIYLGDTARVPYGNRSAETIHRYAQECVEFLLQHSVHLIMVACNTISSVALPLIEKIAPVPVVGVIFPAANEALRHSSRGVIGVIGTRATVQARSYETAIRQLAGGGSDLTIYSQACPLFVPLVEEGLQDHAATYEIAREYLLPFRDAGLESLILGCTHYPLLKKVISDIMPGVRLIDSGEQAALEVVRKLSKSLVEIGAPQRSIECYVTDRTPTFVRLAEDFLGISSANVLQVSIESRDKVLGK